jgi:hypothetical protein
MLRTYCNIDIVILLPFLDCRLETKELLSGWVLLPAQRCERYPMQS